MLGPRSPQVMETLAEALSGTIIGTRKGLMLRTPFSMNLCTLSMRLSIPPIPVPTMTPML